MVKYQDSNVNYIERIWCYFVGSFILFFSIEVDVKAARSRHHHTDARHTAVTTTTLCYNALPFVITHCTHAKNNIAGRIIPFLVLGFWDTNTGVCTGAMPYRRDILATTGIKAFEAETCIILPANVFLAWVPVGITHRATAVKRGGINLTPCGFPANAVLPPRRMRQLTYTAVSILIDSV